MPSALPAEDDDPVVATYDVYMTDPVSHDTSNQTESSKSQLFVLQYPSHRPLDKPYNADWLQKPTRLKLKPNTGMVEVEVPILTEEHFNAYAGQKYGQALVDSRVSHLGGSHGLAGGFASAPHSAPTINLNDVPQHMKPEDRLLNTQTLGGKIVVSSERDPVYMLGSLQQDGLHLTQLDAVVQLRPQLHHLDAAEETEQRKPSSQPGALGKQGETENTAQKRESKAIELKMKDSKEDPKDRSLNQNARLLRDIQADQWTSYEWIDEADQESWQKARALTDKDSVSNGLGTSRKLKSMFTNDEWLERMSVPRDEGKKGLRAKLKGRDRERARRKKVENERRQLNTGAPDLVTRAGASSDSDLSSVNEHSDVEKVNSNADVQPIDIKEEPGTLAAAPAAVPSVPDSVPVTDAPKRRGRPKRTG